MPSKLQIAHDRAARVSTLSGGSLLIGLSGKDSFVTLTIAAEHFKTIACFNMYFVRGLRCYEAPLEAMCSRFGATLHHVPHPELCRMMKYAVLRPHSTRLDNVPRLKKADAERLARKRSGVEWIAYGERLADSFARRLFWRKLDGIYEAGKRCTLIPEWLDADVAGFMHAKKLPAPCTFGGVGRSSEFALTPSVLGWLKARHPNDYARVLRVFPAAGAQLLSL